MEPGVGSLAVISDQRPDRNTFPDCIFDLDCATLSWVLRDEGEDRREKQWVGEVGRTPKCQMPAESTRYIFCISTSPNIDMQLTNSHCKPEMFKTMYSLHLPLKSKRNVLGEKTGHYLPFIGNELML